ncbi:23S rRNA pseudouridylate synthase B [Malikia granosa]|uniref:Pseudouridine synthase n=2 Tax=Malikia granosa TaxID=263067 RepID=A0A2S9K1Y7_9BURK|nr:pseudouridine synthase [Malikia granosa]PRD64478.1 23S rRNA pseudouridylate synthase B [Malikia granosa]
MNQMPQAPSDAEPSVAHAAAPAEGRFDLVQEQQLFADLVSGEFDAAQDAELPDEGKRVLLPQADAPKLHKVLAQAGLGSRLEMERLIQEGRISVNNEPAHVGQRIQHGDQIKINGKPVRVRIAPPPPRVLAYHKPAGEVVTHDDPQNRPTVFRRLPRLYNGKWQSVGRLDLNTEGLLLFTDSGELANKLMHPRFGLQREYAVRVLGALSNEEKDRLLEGVRLDDGMAQFQSIEDGGGDGANCWYRVTIAEGRNREVRRMFEAVGHAVSRLIRIRYGAVVLPRGLRRGVWTELDYRDIERLTLAAGMRRTDEQAQDSARKAASRNPTPRRNKGQGPRPSAPKLVEGPAISRSSGRAIREPRYGHDEPGFGEQAPFGRQAEPRDQRAPRDMRGRAAGQPDPTQNAYGYIGAEAGQKRKGPGLYAGGKSGRPGSPGGQGGPRKGPRR